MKKIYKKAKTADNEPDSWGGYRRKMNLAMSVIFLVYGISLFNPNKTEYEYVNRFGEYKVDNPANDGPVYNILGIITVSISLYYINKFRKQR